MEEAIAYKNYAEIDLCRLAHNFRLLCERAWAKNEKAKPICVVKADAYGHGARECVQTLISEGADFFAVSDIGEALQIREVSGDVKILILGYIDPKNAPLLAKHDIIQTVHCYEYALALDSEASKCDKKIKIHIKLDTGMSRIGFATGKDLSTGVEGIKKTSHLSHLEIDGVFSHLACADEEGSDLTQRQLETFDEALATIRECGIECRSHICNSAGAIRFGSAGHDYFRLGISLYGYKPSPEMHIEGLLPVMSLYSSVAQVHTLRKGDTVSYGATFCADKEMKVATIPIGYADGLMRASSGECLLIGKKKAKILGRVCMDQCIVCVDGIEVKEGERVTVYDQEGENIEALARHLGTISYELVCAVGKRIPRLYV